MRPKNLNTPIEVTIRNIAGKMFHLGHSAKEVATVIDRILMKNHNTLRLNSN